MIIEKKNSKRYRWFRVDKYNKKEIIPITGTSYKLRKIDVGKRICVKYTPIRNDGKRGEIKCIVSDVVTSSMDFCKMIFIF